MLHKLSGLISQAAASFHLSIPPPRSFALVLEEANAELGRINQQYEQMYHELMAKASELDVAYKELNTLTDALNEKNRLLAEMAARDGLTDLFNHRYFQEFMRQQVLQAQRYDRPLSLILLDIDHFKDLNDTYGHQFGDVILKELADILRSSVRKADIVARYGGEEFGIIMPDTDSRGAAVAGEKIRHTVEQHRTNVSADKAIEFTISLGVAQYTGKMTEAGELVGAADSCLYEAKRSGRNRMCVAR